MLARSLLVLASLLLPGALHAEGTPAEKTGFASRLTICLANGPLDACGPGCDRWIAIEGDIDQDARGVMRGGDAGSEKPLARGPLATNSLAARPHSQPPAERQRNAFGDAISAHQG